MSTERLHQDIGKTNKYRILILLIPFFMVFLGTSFLSVHFPTFHESDEGWHYYVIQKYSGDFLRFNFVTYDSSNTPLYYFIMSVIGAPFGNNIQILRIANLIFSLLAFYVFNNLLIKRMYINASGALIYTSLLALSPYIFGASFILLTDNFTLLLAISSLNNFFRYSQDNKVTTFILGVLFSALTVLSRQNYLWVHAIGCSLVILNVKPLARKFLFSFFLFVSLIPLAYLFFYWKGLTPPGHQSHHETLVPNLKTISLTISLLGFYSLFILPSYILQTVRRFLSGWKQFLKIHLDCIFVALFALLFLFFFPVNRNMPGTDGFLLQMANRIHMIFNSSILLWFLMPLGGCVAYHYTVKKKNYLILSMLLVFLVINLPSIMMFQKYFDYFVLILIIFLRGKDDLRNLDKAGIVLLFLFFIGYCVIHILSFYNMISL